MEDGSYGASSSVQLPRFAKLNTTNPGVNKQGWCPTADDSAPYLQINLADSYFINGLATKGQDFTGSERWVTSYYITYSGDGLSFTDYTEGGQRKNFTGNTEPTSIVLHEINITTPARVIRFHPLDFVEQACMRASVFGCLAPVVPPPGQLGDPSAQTGILIALWILAGILSFLLLMACCYYCCWHVCCGRGKKRRGLTAFRHTWMDDTDGYLIENLEKRWRLPSADIMTAAKSVPQDEIQEVIVDMQDENFKPSGVIQFGIEAEVSKEAPVTADTVHSETPTYSEDAVDDVKSGASMISLSSDTARYASIARQKRIKSDSSAAEPVLRAASLERNSQKGQRRGSGVTNEGFTRSKEWLLDDSPQARPLTPEVRRAVSADELAVVDYDMFAPPSGQPAFRSELGRDGYMRMKQTNPDSTYEALPLGNADVTTGAEQVREAVLMENEDPLYAEIRFNDEGEMVEIK